MEDSRGVGGGLADDGFRNHPTRAMVTSLVPLVYQRYNDDCRTYALVQSIESIPTIRSM